MVGIDCLVVAVVVVELVIRAEDVGRLGMATSHLGTTKIHEKCIR